MRSQSFPDVAKILIHIQCTPAILTSAKQTTSLALRKFQEQSSISTAKYLPDELSLPLHLGSEHVTSRTANQVTATSPLFQTLPTLISPLPLLDFVAALIDSDFTTLSPGADILDAVPALGSLRFS